MNPNPPTLPEALLRLLLPPSHRDDVAQDLADAYEDQIGKVGDGFRLRFWYWAQVLSPSTLRLVVLLRTRNRRLRRSSGTEHRGSGGPRGSSLGAVVQDLRYAFRALRRNRGFALLVILSLGLGIGANTALFSIVNGVILEPLPFPDADRLVGISEVDPDLNSWGFSPPNFRDLRDQTAILDGVAAVIGTSMTLTGGTVPERVPIQRVSSGFFSLLNRPPILGRSFLPGEELSGTEPVAVLSHGAWQARWGGDPDVLGRIVVLNGVPRTVVGVAPEGMRLTGAEPEAWVPIGFSERDLALRGRHFLQVFARITPGVDMGLAQGNLTDLWTRLGEEYPDTNAGWTITVAPLLDSFVGSARTPLLLLLGAAGLVLLVACVNVTNLGLSKAEGQSREFAIRSALGSSRARLLRQQLLEHLILGLGGGGLGLALAFVGTGRLLLLFGNRLPRAENVALDGRVLLFTLLTSLVVGLLTAVIPITRKWVGTLSSTLVGRELRFRADTSGRRLRGVFVVAEVALSLTLVTGTALLLISFLHLNRMDLGFRIEGVLAGEVNLPETRYESPEEISRFYSTFITSLEERPEIVSAGAVGVLPLTFGYSHDFTRVGGQEDESWDAQDRLSTPGYFRTMGIPILAGRAFTDDDDGEAPFVAILNETLARQAFPGESAVGERVKLKGFPDGESWEVVGVVGDTRLFGARSRPPLTLYRPHSQFRPDALMSLVVRGEGAPGEMARTVKDVAATLDPGLPVTRLGSMEQLLSESIATDRLLLSLVGLFGGLAVILGALGVFSVMSYAVNARIREIGVRMAVGGTPQEVLRMVIRQGMILVALGLVLGFAGSLAVGRLLSGILFGVDPADPVTLLTVTSLVTMVSLTACFIPARTAASVDPAISLRDD